MECVVVRQGSAGDIAAPSGVLAPGQVTAINSGSKASCPICSDLKIRGSVKPTVPPPFYRYRGDDHHRHWPQRTKPCDGVCHVDAVMIVSEFERIAVLLRIGSHACGVLFHRLADARQRHVDGLEEARIVSGRLP